MHSNLITYMGWVDHHTSSRAPHFTPQHWLLCHMGLY